MDIVKEGYYNKLKNRLFSCLCEREAERDWESCLDAILIELMGVPEEDRTINYYVVFYRLSCCRYLNYKYFRKTIFGVMNMLTPGFKEGQA